MAKYFSTFFFILLSYNLLLSPVYGDKIVPCYFVFGDSLVDNGNNNALNSLAKANYLPYGIDYPGGPTGRFTNGRNVADFIAELLGLDNHIPPFATANGDAVLNGVNYASGGAGILDQTGKQFGKVISLDEQLGNHKTTIRSITTVLGSDDSAQKHLNQCIYHVGMGSNDYANYAMMPTMSPEQFASFLVDKYSTQLRDLYSSGARKVAIFGLGPIGCVPAAPMKGITNGTSCVSTTNEAVKYFNDKVKALVDVLNKDLSGAKFTYIDTYGITVSDAAFNGMNANIPCCTVSGLGTCIAGGLTCNSRSDYVYFDGVHPSEDSAGILGRRAFKAQLMSDAYPIDIQNLARA